MKNYYSVEMLEWLYEHQRDDDQLKVERKDGQYLVTAYNERESHVIKKDYHYDQIGRISATDASVLEDRHGKLVDQIVDHFDQYYDQDGRHELIRGISVEERAN